MNRKELYDLGTRILSFQPEICGEGDSGRALFTDIAAVRPEVLYYVKSISHSVFGRQCQISLTYEHQSYPQNKVHVPAASEIEDLLRQTVMNYEPKLVLVLPKSTNLKWIMNQFMTKSISFYPNVHSYSQASFGYDFVPYRAYEINFTYRIGRVKLRQMELDVNEKIRQLKFLLFPLEMPDSVKCYIAHHYLACTVEYYDSDTANPLERSYLQSAYGALIRKKCVCQGYAEAYKRILDSVGVPCDLVSGRIPASDTKEESWHAWNIVHLNRNRIHCHVDVTWDAMHGHADTTYFLKGDSFFNTRREWSRHYYSPCTDGSALLKEARLFCEAHKKELLNAGLRAEWFR